MLVLSTSISEQNVSKNFDMRFDPLTLCKIARQPKREIQFLNKTSATVFAFWFYHGTASYHFEN